MSISIPSQILDRISVAEECSPIAVFITINPANGKDALDSIFAATVHGQKATSKKDPNLVGVFHKYNDMDKVKETLIKVFGGK